MRRFVIPPTEALFRLVFTYDCFGEEHVPAQGPAVVASNHPSYLDPILLSLQVPRPIHFMAWDALFRVPLLGALMRSFGAFPVDVRPGRGREAFERARALLEAGHVVGVFPEGKRSRTGWMEPALRGGAARLALSTGAPLVPATITGAFRAWPYFQPVPRPARVRVRYHPPIDPAPFAALPEEAAVDGLLAALRVRVDRSLLPGVKADLRTEFLYRLPARPVRAYEVAVPLVLGALVAVRSGPAAAWPAAAWLAWLIADLRVLPQRRIVKWARTVLPVAALLAWLPTLSRDLGAPPPAAPAALFAVAGGALLAYVYERRIHTMDVVRGLVFALLLGLALQWSLPQRAGAHVALPLFLAVFAAVRRTVFWPSASTVLGAYACAAPVILGASPALAAHAAAGLLAALAVQRWPVRLRQGSTAR